MPNFTATFRTHFDDGANEGYGDFEAPISARNPWIAREKAKAMIGKEVNCSEWVDKLTSLLLSP